MESRESLINQIDLLHEEKEHQKIIALIEGQPPAAMDYELTCLLARAYINYAQPYMDSFREHIKHAVELLRSIEAEGMADPQWYYRIGTALYWQDEEESAMTYLEQCLAMDPTHEDAPQVIEECKRALERRTVVRPLDMRALVDFFERNDYRYDVEDNRLRTGFTNGYYVFSVIDDGADLSMWGGIREDVSMELRPRLIQACNDWNAATKWPKVYVATLDDGTQRVCAEQFVSSRYGMTDAQVSINIDRFISASEAFFKEQIERIPALGGASE